MQCTRLRLVLPFNLNSDSNSTILSNTVLTWDVFPVAERVTVLGHEVPIRFGGHSWQAIACIWKI